LVVGYQYAHEYFCRTFHASAPIIAKDFSCCQGLARRRCSRFGRSHVSRPMSGR
jgi:hypothetical protein